MKLWHTAFSAIIYYQCFHSFFSGLLTVITDNFKRLWTICFFQVSYDF